MASGNNPIYFECLGCGGEHRLEADSLRCPACGSGNGVTSSISRSDRQRLADADSAQLPDSAG